MMGYITNVEVIVHGPTCYLAMYVTVFLIVKVLSFLRIFIIIIQWVTRRFCITFLIVRIVFAHHQMV